MTSAPAQCPFDVTVQGRDGKAAEGYRFLRWFMRYEWRLHGQETWDKIHTEVHRQLLFGKSA